MEDSELNSDRTLDDDEEDMDKEDQSSATSSPLVSEHSRRPESVADHDSRQLPTAAVELGRLRQSDTADSNGKDSDWTYPDDNSPDPQHRERRDSGVGSSLTRCSRSVLFIYFIVIY